ncbi:MAG TPA: glutamate--cysteine ligase, partial [Devosia sp.]|nr:glutamate--cysteine ligase [Devosia sp.]
MSTRTASDGEERLIESRDQLAAPMQAGEKPASAWRIGTEHEKLVFAHGDHHAPSYDEPHGIRDMLLALKDYGWEPVEEGGNIIAM